jgi:hypothetical protein
MPIIVTPGQPCLNLVGSIVSTNGSATITLPSGMLQNDVCYVVGCSSFAETVNAQNGFINLFATERGIKPQSFIFRKVMGSSPDTTCNFGANGANCIWQSFAYRGARVDSPEGAMWAAGTTTVAMPNPPAVAFESGQTQVVILGFLDQDDAASGLGAPSGYGNISGAQRGMGGTVSCTNMFADRRVDFALPDQFYGAEDPGAFTGTGSDAYFSVTMTILPAGTRWCSQSEAFFARLSTQPTEKRKALYDSLIRKIFSQQVALSISFDGLWILAAADSTTALTNLINANCKMEVKGSPTFAADLGYTGNGTDGYLDTQINPSTASGQGVNFRSTTAWMAAWSNTASGGSGALMGQSNSNTQTYLYSRGTSNASRGACRVPTATNQEANNNFNSTVAQNGTGFFATSSSAAGIGEIGRNGGVIIQATQPAMETGNNSNICILRAGGASANFGTQRVMAAAVGSAFGFSSGVAGSPGEYLVAGALRAYLMEVAGITYAQDQQ